jgi:hypothetical protein
MSTIPNTFLNDLLDPLAQCFTPAVAQEVVNLRFDVKVQEKFENLRQRANEGSLTPEERAEYEALIETFDFIAVLQAKSRQLLQNRAGKQLEEPAHTRLSARDRDLFIALLDAPPEPNDVLRQAASRYREHCG